MSAAPSNATDRRRGAVPRIALATAVGLSAVNMLGLGAFASWTDSEVDQVAVDSGTLGIVLGADGATNRLSVDAVNIAPGDVIQRAVTLGNDGSIDLSSVTLTTSSLNASLLYAGAERLDLRIKACDVAWTETAEASGGYSYVCAGAETYVLGSAAAYGDVQQAGTVLPGIATLTAGGLDHLVVDMRLPQTAGNDYQGLTEVVTFTFDAVQRDGTFR